MQSVAQNLLPHRSVYIFSSSSSVDSNIKCAQARQKKNYDAQHTAPTFKIGEEVLKKNLKNKHRMGGKLDAKWLGPYIVTGVTAYGNYKLRCKQNGELLKQCVPSAHLKKYIHRPDLKVNNYNSNIQLYTIDN